MHSAVDITSKVYWNARADRRATPRTEVRLSGQVGSEARETAFVVLRDISTDGFSFRCFEYFAPGARIWLDLPGVGVRQAEVIWEDVARTGCRFETPLADAEFEQVIAGQAI